MRNLGELMLYIETIDFKDKADLKRQLEDANITYDNFYTNRIDIIEIHMLLVLDFYAFI